MDLTTFFQKLGLDDKESNIYVTLLEFGPSPASIIANKVKLKRTTIYYILDELIKKGFVKKTIHHNINYFSPIDPSTISEMINTKIDRLKDLKKDLRTQMAVLQTLQNKPAEKPRITYHEGTDGARKAYEDTLTAQSEILEIDLPDDIHEAISEEWLGELIKKRVHRKIPLKAIIPDTPTCLKYHKLDKKQLRETIPVPCNKENLAIHSSIMIYDNKINIINLKKNCFGILIENRYLAETMRTLFTLAWEAAQKYKSGDATD